MKAPKNFEGIFIAAAIFSTVAAYATADVPVVRASAPVARTAVVAAEYVPVVQVTGKRLSAAEKSAVK